MTNEIVQDELLLSVLDAAHSTRTQALSILDYLEQNRIAAGSAPSEASLLELSKRQKVLTAHLARVRGLYRTATYDARDTKQRTAEAKSEIDTLHLHLQNLLYEQTHLKGEIAACEDYPHKYTTLSLVPAEQFLTSHPEYQGTNEHDLMIARIQDEQAQRQALEEQRQGLLKRKQAMIAENKRKKDELDALDREVEKYINGTDVIQKIFDAKMEKETSAAISVA